jgi:hypothetical protein
MHGRPVQQGIPLELNPTELYWLVRACERPIMLDCGQNACESAPDGLAEYLQAKLARFQARQMSRQMKSGRQAE